MIRRVAGVYLLILQTLAIWRLSFGAVHRVYVSQVTKVPETLNLSSGGIRFQAGFLPQEDQSGCGSRRERFLEEEKHKRHLRVDLKHRHSRFNKHKRSQQSLLVESLRRDSARLELLRTRIVQNMLSSNPLLEAHLHAFNSSDSSSSSIGAVEVESTVESGASLGAGEYFMDMYIGTPAKHFSVIIDTGSDLTWLQCTPCEDCYTQAGPLFVPSESTSYKPVRCNSPVCDLVTHYVCPEGSQADASNCRYLYSYGDSSQTSGDLALETLLVNLAGEKKSRVLEIQDMVFGCGHNNKGLFQGAGGLLGLGQGALSFSSQLNSSPIGKAFSYCLVDRTNNMSVSSAISFGNEFALSRHFGENSMKFTPFVRTNNSVDTFYYLGVSGLKIDNQTLSIPADKFSIAANGSGGTIIDSGTTITYWDPDVYRVVEEGFMRRIQYPRSDPFDVLGLCYNVTGVADVKFPRFSIVFENGVELELPQKNYFIQPDETQPVHCMALLPTSGISIIGNFQQQNIHFLYDVENSRLGFARTDCSAL